MQSLQSSYSSRCNAAGRVSSRVVQVHCSFSFAKSERANKPVGRRNRWVEKKQEGELRSIAQGLCNFNGKQLQAVGHLLSDEHIKQIKIGMDIPPTNQGRRRQVGLVMGLLRTDLDESTLAKLSEAVQQSARHNLPYADSDVEQQVDVWMAGLLANDQEVMDELFEALQAKQQDMQQLRTWVRQLQLQQQQRGEEQLEQQQQQELKQQQRAEASWPAVSVPVQQREGAKDAGIAVQDPEVLQLIHELNQGGAEGGLAGSSKPKGKAGKSPAAAARRSLRRVLKSLALEQL